VSRQASPAAIGAFVLGAIALVVGGLVVFGGGLLFRDTSTYVMYFDDSVTGLSPGADVTFRGVKVGEVTRIIATIDEQLDIDIPVFVEIGGGVLEQRSGDPAEASQRGRVMPILIKRGLRAQLGLQSLVTGQLHVALDFHPDRPAEFRGDGRVPEIPTIASPLSEIRERFQELPLKDIAAEALGVLRSIERFVGSEELTSSLRNLDGTLLAMRRVAETLEAQLPPLSESANDAFSALSEDSPTRYALDDALVEVAAAARAVRALADYLERHPESLLSGKSEETP